jgi:fumarate reductase iron-sulfur subunit
MSNNPESRNGSVGVFKVKVKRFNPATDAESYWQTYEVPRNKVSRLLDVLEYIHTHLDPTLACRRHYCRDLVCNACFINYQHKPRMSCMTPLNEKVTDDVIVLEPQSGYRVIRDLVVDFLDKTD